MAKAKKKFYVVWTGRTPGIYTVWDDCKAQTEGFKGSEYKSFGSLPEAESAYGKPASTSIGSTTPKGTESKSPSPKASQSYLEETGYTLFCDGGCNPNPGPSGTGLMVYKSGSPHQYWSGHYESNGTNNRAELLGLLEALRYIRSLSETGEVNIKKKAVVYCDSQYAINCVTKWAGSWAKNGWVTKKGDPVLNKDLIEQIRKDFVDLHARVDIRKVKGHSGVEGNEFADQLAGIAIQNKTSGWEEVSLKKIKAFERLMTSPSAISMSI